MALTILPMPDPWPRLSPEDRKLAASILVNHNPEPDLEIAPDGSPYLYRWHIVPRNERANSYLHIQVASDPGGCLHDHPWDNFSVVLSGGYNELINVRPRLDPERNQTRHMLYRRKGDTIARTAETAHRLILPASIPYTMTLFSTGPVRREWGYWFPEGWRHHEDVIETVDGKSSWKEPSHAA